MMFKTLKCSICGSVHLYSDLSTQCANKDCTEPKFMRNYIQWDLRTQPDTWMENHSMDDTQSSADGFSHPSHSSGYPTTPSLPVKQISHEQADLQPGTSSPSDPSSGEKKKRKLPSFLTTKKDTPPSAPPTKPENNVTFHCGPTAYFLNSVSTSWTQTTTSCASHTSASSSSSSPSSSSSSSASSSASSSTSAAPGLSSARLESKAIFKGEVVYVGTTAEAEKIASELLLSFVPDFVLPPPPPPQSPAIVTIDLTDDTPSTTETNNPNQDSSMADEKTTSTTATTTDTSPATTTATTNSSSSITTTTTSSSTATTTTPLVTAGALGFDIEWRTTFERGVAPRKAALLQLALLDKTYLFHIWYIGVGPWLKALLEHPAIAMVGNNISGDVNKMRTDYQVDVKNWIDLGHVANARVPCNIIKRWSLSALCEYFLHQELAKDPDVRLGNWEVRPLNPTQMIYAATDAWVGLVLYNLLLSIPLRALPQPRAPPEDLKANPPSTAFVSVNEGEAKVSSTLSTCVVQREVGLPPSRHTFTEIDVPLVYLPLQDKLSALKLAAHTEWHQNGHDMQTISQMRNVRVSTVESYLYDAIMAGHPYKWQRLLVSDYLFALTLAALQHCIRNPTAATAAASETSSSSTSSVDASNSSASNTSASSSAPLSESSCPSISASAPSTTTSSNAVVSSPDSASAPPVTSVCDSAAAFSSISLSSATSTSPPTTDTAATITTTATTATATTPSSSVASASSTDPSLHEWRPSPASSPLNCDPSLYKIAVGKGGAISPSFPPLKDLKMQLPEEVSYSQIKFVLAHIFRMTCMPKWAELQADDKAKTA